MNKLFALLQLLAALLAAALAALTIGQMVEMVRMSDTISVVHLLVGQLVLAACLLAIARSLLRRALTRLRTPKS